MHDLYLRCTTRLPTAKPIAVAGSRHLGESPVARALYPQLRMFWPRAR